MGKETVGVEQAERAVELKEVDSTRSESSDKGAFEGFSGLDDRGTVSRTSSGKGSELYQVLEALLMVTSEPLTVEKASNLLDVSASLIEDTIAELSEFYRSTSRGFLIQKVMGGYRYATSPELSGYLEKFAMSQPSPRLSSAALETLAIVAYRQPVSRAQIASIRGVNSDSVVKMLLAKGYVEVSGRDFGPGSAVLYSTTPMFLEKLGLNSLSDLPLIEGFVPGPEIAEAFEASLFDND